MKTSQILSIAKFIFWIIFIGLLIKAGTLLFNFGMSFYTPKSAQNLYLGLDLFELLNQNTNQFVAVFSLFISVIIMQAYVAYLIIKIATISHLKNPFTETVAQLINRISYMGFSIGIISGISSRYCDRLIQKGTEIPLDWHSKEFIFFAGIIFIISKVFQKGIELQRESELTI